MAVTRQLKVHCMTSFQFCKRVEDGQAQYGHKTPMMTKPTLHIEW